MSLHAKPHLYGLAVTRHLHFWQNELDLLCAVAVTWGWNGYRNKSAQKVDPGGVNSPVTPAEIRTRHLLRHESGALTTEPPPRYVCVCVGGGGGGAGGGV